MIPSDPDFDPNHPIYNPAHKPNITEYGTNDVYGTGAVKRGKYDANVTCPSSRVPEPGNLQDAMYVVNALEHITSHTPIIPDKQNIANKPCRTLACLHGLIVFWCFWAPVSYLYPFVPLSPLRCEF